MQLSVINRVRFTAWAWLASAFLLGLATGGVAVAVPLWGQLQGAKDEAARLQQVDSLVRRVDPGADVVALASLEGPALVGNGRRDDKAAGGKMGVERSVPSGVAAAEAAPAPVAEVAPKIAPDPAPLPVAAAIPASQPAASEVDKKTAEARKALQAAEDVDRKAKAERQAKLEREQKAAKSAQDAQAKKARDLAEAAARQQASEQSGRKEAPVQIAPPVPAQTNGPTERVTKEEAGVSEVQASGVTFKSGRRVAVGESFPSGERLISVDPAIGEIITSKRRIVLKATAVSAQ